MQIKVPINDSNIKYFGRWDNSHKDTYKTNWVGAYLKVNFTGSKIKLILSKNAKQNFCAIIDGIEIFYKDAYGMVDLTVLPLSNGTHSLIIIATDTQYPSTLYFKGLMIEECEKVILPQVRKSLIEFIGDSITAGFKTSKGVLSSYSYLASEELGCEHIQVAHTGINLTDAWIGSFVTSKIGISKQYFNLSDGDHKESPPWDFSVYKPDLVVINIGTNDRCFNVPEELFRQAYINFIKKVREVHPSIPIIVLKTFGGFMNTPTEGAIKEIKYCGDGNIHLIESNNWLTKEDFPGDDMVHPNDIGHRRAAKKLALELKRFIK